MPFQTYKSEKDYSKFYNSYTNVEGFIIKYDFHDLTRLIILVFAISILAFALIGCGGQSIEKEMEILDEMMDDKDMGDDVIMDDDMIMENNVNVCEAYNADDFLAAQGKVGFCRELTPLELKLWLWTADCMKITGEVSPDFIIEDLMPPGVVEILPGGRGLRCGGGLALACAAPIRNVILLSEGHINTFHFDVLSNGNLRGTIWIYIHEMGHLITWQISERISHAFNFYDDSQTCIFRFTGKDAEFIDAEICEFE